MKKALMIILVSSFIFGLFGCSLRESQPVINPTSNRARQEAISRKSMKKVEKMAVELKKIIKSLSLENQNKKGEMDALKKKIEILSAENKKKQQDNGNKNKNEINGSSLKLEKQMIQLNGKIEILETRFQNIKEGLIEKVKDLKEKIKETKEDLKEKIKEIKEKIKSQD